MALRQNNFMARKLLFVLLMAFALANIARCGLAVQQAITLPDLPLPAAAWANALAGAVWAIGFGLGALGVFLRLRVARRGAPGLMALYHAHMWLNRALFARSENAPLTIEFNLALTALAIVLAAALAFLSRRSLRE